MDRQRKIAVISGSALILMALVAGFAMGYAYPMFSDTGKFDLAQRTLAEHAVLYNVMLAGILLIIALDILVAWTLYQFFFEDDARYALIAFVLRIIYTLLFCWAANYLVKNIGQADGPTIMAHFDSFQFTWSIALIIFGFHLLAIALLMKWHGAIPKALWILMFIAGASYVVIHLLKTAAPSSAALASTLEKVLALPMALAELGFAVWLVVKGGKTTAR